MEFKKMHKIMYILYKIIIISNYYNFFLNSPFSFFIQFIFSCFYSDLNVSRFPIVSFLKFKVKLCFKRLQHMTQLCLLHALFNLERDESLCKGM